MISTPTILAVVIAVSAGLAFTGGFAVSNWRSSAQIQRLNSDNAVLHAANDKCATDIQSVHSAMDALAAASAKQKKQAARAMQVAAADAARHKKRAKKLNALPPVKPEHQYEVIVREQAAYVQSRHEDR
ncbi:MAG TPA: hypothetical protein VF780_06035 [Nitrosospira sp.]